MRRRASMDFLEPSQETQEEATHPPPNVWIRKRKMTEDSYAPRPNMPSSSSSSSSSLSSSSSSSSKDLEQYAGLQPPPMGQRIEHANASIREEAQHRQPLSDNVVMDELLRHAGSLAESTLSPDSIPTSTTKHAGGREHRTPGSTLPVPDAEVRATEAEGKRSEENEEERTQKIEETIEERKQVPLEQIERPERVEATADATSAPRRSSRIQASQGSSQEAAAEEEEARKTPRVVRKKRKKPAEITPEGEDEEEPRPKKKKTQRRRPNRMEATTEAPASHTATPPSNLESLSATLPLKVTPEQRRDEILSYLRLWGYNPPSTILQVHRAALYGKRAKPTEGEIARREATKERYGGTTLIVIGRTHDPTIEKLVAPPAGKQRGEGQDVASSYVGYFHSRKGNKQPPHTNLPLDFTPNAMQYPDIFKKHFALVTTQQNKSGWLVTMHTPSDFAPRKNELNRAIYRAARKHDVQEPWTPWMEEVKSLGYNRENEPVTHVRASESAEIPSTMQTTQTSLPASVVVTAERERELEGEEPHKKRRKLGKEEEITLKDMATQTDLTATDIAQSG